MTDNEIIKALEICDSGTCEGCKGCHGYDCVPVDMGTILSLIKRQKAEIERLKYNLKAVLDERADHSEAIKEFAERLKKVSAKRTRDVYGERIFFKDIDNLVKEMVGDNNE